MLKLRSFFSPSVLAVAAVASLPCAIPAIAQVDRSAVTGTITDPSGRLLGQAHVTAVENATRLRREGVSDAAGRYEIAELPVGRYTVTVAHAGFETVTFADVEQVVGRTRTLNTALKVAGGEEHVKVTAGSELLDTNESTVTGLIERKQADELPLNGRDWSGLTAYAPGAIDTGGSNQRSIRFAGRGLDDSNFTYDGVDATNVINQTQRAWARLAIPLDAIAEFRVDTLGTTAEDVPSVDAVASRPADGSAIFVKLSNADPRHTIYTHIQIDYAELESAVQLAMLTSEISGNRNTFATPEVIVPRQQMLHCRGASVIALPPDTVAVLTLHRKM